MKITQVLWKFHIGRMIKRHWWVQGQKVLEDTQAENILEAKGIQIVDPKVLTAPPKFWMDCPEIVQTTPKPQPLDETHPNWNEMPCLQYLNDSLIVEGTDQAQVLTKSQCKLDGLPARISTLEEIPSQKIEELIERHVWSTYIFDAYQQKLPKVKDPLRPAWNFPRYYGITDMRRTHNFVQKMLQVCELISDPMTVQQRQIINNSQVRTFIEKENDLLYFESGLDTMITSNKPLTSMYNPDEPFDAPSPQFYPLLPTIGLDQQNIYNIQDHYPVSSGSPWMNPHTIFLSYNSETVKNKTGLPVRETQILARSLLKSFATAACYAKQKFGEETLDLPEPVCVQCVQSNGKWFHFSAFQLNTLNISGDGGKKNIWWSKPRIDLFDKAEYVRGVPTLEGYNPEVFKQILTFYRNV